MANEIRRRYNFKSGTITDNPLTNSATTMNSTNLAGLPAIGSTEYAVLVLDPAGTGNGPEVVYVTAHTGSATSATIVRGREGTTAVQHNSNVTWIHVATAADYPVVGGSSDQPSGTGLPYEGQLYVDTTNDRSTIYSGSAWIRQGWYSSSGRTGFALRRVAGQSVNNDAAANISWDTEDFDSDNFFAPTSATVTIPSGLGGLYSITFQIETGFPFNGSAARMSISAGGVFYASGWAAYDGRGLHTVTIPLAAADTVVCAVYQNVGVTASFTGRLYGYRIGP